MGGGRLTVDGWHAPGGREGAACHEWKIKLLAQGNHFRRPVPLPAEVLVVENGDGPLESQSNLSEMIE